MNKFVTFLESTPLLSPMPVPLPVGPNPVPNTDGVVPVVIPVPVFEPVPVPVPVPVGVPMPVPVPGVVDPGFVVGDVPALLQKSTEGEKGKNPNVKNENLTRKARRFAAKSKHKPKRGSWDY
ncbi:unnamed protein product [Linum trigynum]|uniref:Uncharacterized protein n=1 Tax=Linum trigynum TaxID=586398 RepID=A0AAV2CUI1_9ROSI